MHSQTKYFIVEISLKRNEALSVLATSTRKPIEELEHVIIERLRDVYLIMGIAEDCGLSIQEIANRNGLSIHDVINIILPENRTNQEISELLKSVFIWGESHGHECENCGCEIESESFNCLQNGKTWANYWCSNSQCNNRWSNEPDWDTMKGGKDYDNE